VIIAYGENRFDGHCIDRTPYRQFSRQFAEKRFPKIGHLADTLDSHLGYTPPRSDPETERNFMGLARISAAVACSALLALSAAPAFGAPASPPDPATTVYEAGGGNLGECSAFLGTLQLRDDVNRIIRLHGDQLGIENPGQIYHVRAQQEVNLPPAQECLQRNVGN
jgi:hypothetical protein